MQTELIHEAEIELWNAADYYESAREELGVRFLAEYEAALERIRLMPNAWQKVSRRSRRCAMRHFPYGVVYQIIEDKALVLSVMDLRRRPGYWKDRERK